MKNLNKIPILRTVVVVLLTFLTLTQVANAATNTFTFNNTTVGAYTGPNFPAGGALTNISGASLTAGDVVVFDGIIVDAAGATGDSWGAVNLNSGGYLGLTSADLGVLVETGSANTSPCQLFLDGGNSNFAVNQGYTSNRLQIVLTCTQTGSTANMDYQVNIDHGLTGSFNDTLSGSGATFANNTIALTFGSQTAAHLFIQNQPIIALAAPTMTPASGILTPGHTASFTNVFTAGFPLNVSLQWLSNGVPIAGANGLSYTTLPVTASNNGDRYSVVVTNLNNPANVVTSAVDTVTVHSTPGYITFDFADTYYAGGGAFGAVVNPGTGILGSQLLAGDTVLFDALVLGFPGGGSGAWVAIDFNGSGYGNLFGSMGVLTALGPSQQNGQLFINGTQVANISPSGVQTNRVRVELFPSSSGSTTNMGWLVEVDQNVSGTFLPAFTGTNLTFPGNSIPLTFGFQLANALITENPQAVSIYSDASPTSQSVPLGGPATVSILAKGWSPAYQWYQNGSLVHGATNRSYTIASTTLADNGDQFFCVVSNTLNSANVVTSSVAAVNIEIPASVSWCPTMDGTTWNLSVANWTTNGGTSQTLFANGDNVTFDSLGYNLGSTITVTNTVSVSTTTFNVSGSEVYSLAGAGTLNGLNLLLTGDGSGGLDLLTSASFLNATIAAGTLQVGNGSVNGSILANNITNNGTIVFDNASGELIIGGTFAGSGSILKEGGGTTSLTATNNVYTIGAIDAGNLKIANEPMGNFINNATLEFSSAINFPFTNVVSGSGGYFLSGYQTNTFTGVSSFTGRNTFLYAVAIVDNPAALGDPVNGSSDITGSLRLGGLYLSNNITWSQPLSFESRDAVAVAFAPHLNNLSGTNTVTSSLTFNNGGGTEFNVESDSGFLAIQSVLVNNATSNTNILDLQGAGNGEWDGVITDGPGGAGVDSLNVQVRGSGFWALNGINTYSGNTTVSSGTLCGTGVISGAVTVAPSGNLGAGDAGTNVGTLTISNNLTLQGNASLRINKTGGLSTNDQVVVNGNITYAGILTVSNITSDATTLALGNTFPIFSVSGSSSGHFTSIVGSLGGGLAYSFNPANGVLSVVSAAAPLSGLKFTASPVISGTSLTISATNSGAGTVYLLTSTNVAAPFNTWTPIWTNVLSGSGSFTTNLSNVVNPASKQQFYILSNTN